MARSRHSLTVGLIAGALTLAGAQLPARAAPAAAPVSEDAERAPWRPPEHPLAALLRACRVGRPVQYRCLTVFPILLDPRWSGPRYLSVDEGLAAGQLEIRDSGQVDRVLLRNLSQRDVLVLTGEMMIGGKQNRMVNLDVLAPARHETVIPTYCVEKGRWSGGPEPAFGAYKSMVPSELRRQATAGAPQESVWADIAERSRQLSVRSPTQDLRALWESGDVTRELSEFAVRCRPLWRERPVGIAVCRGWQIVGADLCSNPDFFARLRGKLLDSYGLDHLFAPGPLPRKTSGADSIRRFLASAAASRLNYAATPGTGQGLQLSGPVSGAGLWADGHLAHLGLHQVAMPLPGPRPLPE